MKMAELPGFTVKQPAKQASNHFMVSPPLARSAFLFARCSACGSLWGGYEAEVEEVASMKPPREGVTSFGGFQVRQ